MLSRIDQSWSTARLSFALLWSSHLHTTIGCWTDERPSLSSVCTFLFSSPTPEFLLTSTFFFYFAFRICLQISRSDEICLYGTAKFCCLQSRCGIIWRIPGRCSLPRFRYDPCIPYDDCNIYTYILFFFFNRDLDSHP